MHYMEKESALAISYGEENEGKVGAADEEIVKDIFIALNRLIIRKADDQIDEEIAALQNQDTTIKAYTKAASWGSFFNIK